MMQRAELSESTVLTLPESELMLYELVCQTLSVLDVE